MPIGNLPVPGPYAGWGVPWTGFGTVAISPAWSTRVLTMTPAKATMPSVTHSALVTSQASFDNVAFKVVEQTTAQLRTGSTPNPWEVAWVLWDYTNSDNFYALVLKPNGWELDKVTGGVQHFLATGSGRKFPIGSKYSVVINQAGGRLSVSVNSRALVTYTDTSPTALDGGSIGLYCEDSAVRFGDVTLG
jgi:hypothetical protein